MANIFIKKNNLLSPLEKKIEPQVMKRKIQIHFQIFLACVCKIYYSDFAYYKSRALHIEKT